MFRESFRVGIMRLLREICTRSSRRWFELWFQVRVPTWNWESEGRCLAREWNSRSVIWWVKSESWWRNISVWVGKRMSEEISLV